LCFDIPHRGLGRAQVRLCGIDGRSFHSNRVLKRLLVEFGEKLAFVHTVVGINQHPRDLAGDPGSDERHVAVDVGVVRRNGVERCENPGMPNMPTAARTRAASAAISSRRRREGR
jgi:hypothetical protein